MDYFEDYKNMLQLFNKYEVLELKKILTLLTK